MAEFDQTAAMEAFKAECARTSITAVANKVGYARTSVSLVFNGRYPGSTRKFLEEFMAAYGQIACPHLGQEIEPETCRNYATAEAPTHNPMAMQHWRACQNCPHAPERSEG